MSRRSRAHRATLAGGLSSTSTTSTPPSILPTRTRTRRGRLTLQLPSSTISSSSSGTSSTAHNRTSSSLDVETLLAASPFGPQPVSPLSPAALASPLPSPKLLSPGSSDASAGNALSGKRTSFTTLQTKDLRQVVQTRSVTPSPDKERMMPLTEEEEALAAGVRRSSLGRLSFRQSPTPSPGMDARQGVIDDSDSDGQSEVHEEVDERVGQRTRGRARRRERGGDGARAVDPFAPVSPSVAKEADLVRSWRKRGGHAEREDGPPTSVRVLPKSRLFDFEQRKPSRPVAAEVLPPLRNIRLAQRPPSGTSQRPVELPHGDAPSSPQSPQAPLFLVVSPRTRYSALTGSIRSKSSLPVATSEDDRLAALDEQFASRYTRSISHLFAAENERRHKSTAQRASHPSHTASAPTVATVADSQRHRRAIHNYLQRIVSVAETGPPELARTLGAIKLESAHDGVSSSSSSSASNGTSSAHAAHHKSTGALPGRRRRRTSASAEEEDAKPRHSTGLLDSREVRNLFNAGRLRQQLQHTVKYYKQHHRARLALMTRVKKLKKRTQKKQAEMPHKYILQNKADAARGNQRHDEALKRFRAREKELHERAELRRREQERRAEEARAKLAHEMQSDFEKHLRRVPRLQRQAVDHLLLSKHQHDAAVQQWLRTMVVLRSTAIFSARMETIQREQEERAARELMRKQSVAKLRRVLRVVRCAVRFMRPTHQRRYNLAAHNLWRFLSLACHIKQVRTSLRSASYRGRVVLLQNWWRHQRKLIDSQMELLELQWIRCEKHLLATMRKHIEDDLDGASPSMHTRVLSRYTSKHGGASTATGGRSSRGSSADKRRQTRALPGRSSRGSSADKRRQVQPLPGLTRHVAPERRRAAVRQLLWKLRHEHKVHLREYMAKVDKLQVKFAQRREKIEAEIALAGGPTEATDRRLAALVPPPPPRMKIIVSRRELEPLVHAEQVRMMEEMVADVGVSVRDDGPGPDEVRHHGALLHKSRADRAGSPEARRSRRVRRSSVASRRSSVVGQRAQRG